MTTKGVHLLKLLIYVIQYKWRICSIINYHSCTQFWQSSKIGGFLVKNRKFYKKCKFCSKLSGLCIIQVVCNKPSWTGLPGTLISSFDFEFLFRVSISSFDFEFWFQVSISSFDFKFRFRVLVQKKSGSRQTLLGLLLDMQILNSHIWYQSGRPFFWKFGAAKISNSNATGTWPSINVSKRCPVSKRKQYMNDIIGLLVIWRNRSQGRNCFGEKCYHTAIWYFLYASYLPRYFWLLFIEWCCYECILTMISYRAGFQKQRLLRCPNFPFVFSKTHDPIQTILSTFFTPIFYTIFFKKLFSKI